MFGCSHESEPRCPECMEDEKLTINEILESAFKEIVRDHGIQIREVRVRWIEDMSVDGKGARDLIEFITVESAKLVK